MDAISNTPAAAAAHRPAKASELLAELLDAFPHERVTVGELLKRLDGRAYGLLLLLTALPMCLPTPPGVSTIFAVVMFVPAVQMMIGRGHAWLPRRICEWSFSREALRTAVKAALPVLRRIEMLAKPRLSALVSPPTIPVWGVIAFIMAAVLALPLLGGNFPVGVAMTAIGLALLQQDGAMAVLGGVIAAGTVVWAYVLIRLSGAFLQQVGDWIAGLTSWMP